MSSPDRLPPVKRKKISSEGGEIARGKRLQDRRSRRIPLPNCLLFGPQEKGHQGKGEAGQGRAKKFIRRLEGLLVSAIAGKQVFLLVQKKRPMPELGKKGRRGKSCSNYQFGRGGGEGGGVAKKRISTTTTIIMRKKKSRSLPGFGRRKEEKKKDRPRVSPRNKKVRRPGRKGDTVFSIFRATLRKREEKGSS